MELIRILLFPLAVLYGLVARIRNAFFNWGIFRQVSFSLPVISVGNLCAGGSGKTPMVEYLIRLLNQHYRIATLSRGYKRKTNGFLMADETSTSSQIGDEPLQYFRKFKNIMVAVDENRRRGIRSLLNMGNPPGVILLDDAFQHRRVKPGLSILVTDYFKTYVHDQMLPVGRLREPIAGASRAQIIIVTKSPRIFSPILRRQITEELKPAPHQQLFFSYVKYLGLEPVYAELPPFSLKEQRPSTIMMVTGIANPSPMEEYLRSACNELVMIPFPDHHRFEPHDLAMIRQRFDELHSRLKIIVTTEKDAMRLRDGQSETILKNLPVYYLSMQHEFHEEDKRKFDAFILDYLSGYQKEPGAPETGSDENPGNTE
ncbi:MAG TPA: tetraacyldisaccharide 4'-kinase [Bacteroidales bacterium]|nr:tetraacyldisaccharide 4'-kinase [Bacteroidales bacterium]HPT01369.1 tetraacyldisaccharide 4'-kinase [Bacteroidales bacterium]